MIPLEASNLALARCLNLSERRIAQVRGEGRLPVTPGGRIDLRELIRRGWQASLTGQWQQAAQTRTPEDADAFGPLRFAMSFEHPAHRGYAVAATFAIREAPFCAVIAAADAGIARPQAEGLADLVLILLWNQLDDAGRNLGLPERQPGEAILNEGAGFDSWQDRVNWSAFFADNGESRITGRLALQADEGRADVVQDDAAIGEPECQAGESSPA
jgi:hypothetical protein